MKKVTIFALSACLFLSASAVTASAAPVETKKAEHKMHAKEHKAKEHKMHAKEHKMHAKEHKGKAHKIHAKSVKPKALPKTGYGGVSE
ncbi:hypothetical protein [Paenibacillus glucanolyticus]|uniref:hypothetical protein n=1 Tax=Paenibacillus glucanolyticus TaxID=59843 RepID=UPI00096D2F83|nr:hypothetical protein [Paenibacillus glucanolyticus]OMF68221.1 hypothetical protein BK142_27955 [Paenibacillus glucanolyticus]